MRQRKVPIPEATSRYLNRELSWLQFNSRVLAEAESSRYPLLERLRFLSIVESNLDEFFMVRVSGLIEQFESGVLAESPDGLSPSEQLRAVSAGSIPLRQKASDVFRDSLSPELARHGISIVDYGAMSGRKKEALDAYFLEEVFPLCTPLLLHPAVSVPFISNRSLNLAVELGDPGDPRLARVKVPTIIPRLVRVSKRRYEFVLLEDLIASHIDTLFPGVAVRGVHQFRVVRDADVEIRELEASDLITNIEETLRLRRFGDPVLLQHRAGMPAHLHIQLMTLLNLDTQDVMPINGLLGLDVLGELAKIDKPNLRFRPHLPYLAESLATAPGIFESVSASDVLIHLPFDSFRSVEEFVGSAAIDPQVVGVKQTLYRVGAESPIVEALAEAAEEGKQVTALVELKARFDESNNLVWARALERAGAHVTFGFAELKTHCKLCSILRRSSDGLHSFTHVGTGNYNPTTARQYTDLGVFTCDPDINRDVSELFNFLTGFSKQTTFRKILVAPLNLREGILERIRREIAVAKKGKKTRMIWKLNALVDPEVIEEIYAASEAGVKIDLLVRGICCLRPGVAGMSSNIRVMSLIGRFLEHSRVYYFENGGEPDMLIGSADAMRRNLDRRVEVLAPIENPGLVRHIRDHILNAYLNDNTNTWDLRPDGQYARRTRLKTEKPFDAQTWLMENPSTRVLYGR